MNAVGDIAAVDTGFSVVLNCKRYNSKRLRRSKDGEGFIVADNNGDTGLNEGCRQFKTEAQARAYMATFGEVIDL